MYKPLGNDYCVWCVAPNLKPLPTRAGDMNIFHCNFQTYQSGRGKKMTTVP